MISFLSASKDIGMRKDLVRLRMEMHRQQLLYHSQPLTHPLQQVKGMIASRASSGAHRSGKHPLMLATTIVLALLGKRLGRLGQFARIGLTLYPIVRKLR